MLVSYIARRGKDRMRATFKRIVLVLPILVMMLSSVQTAYSSGLVLTINAGKSHNLGENIIINGTLTLDGSPVPDGLVAVQVNNPRGDDPDHLFIMRTLNTGSEPAGPWSVNITEAYACDIDGNPMTSFRTGRAAGFKVTVRNYDASPQDVIATLSLYDSSGNPFATLLMINQTLEAYQTISSHNWIEEIIPIDASIGTAHLYAVAMTNWPQYGGVAWCPEKSSTFSITGSGGGGAATSESPKTSASLSMAPGNFSTSFRTSGNGGLLGNYTIHGTSWYSLSYAISKETFEAVLIADVNKDGTVDILDISLIIDAFMTSPGGHNWNPAADINHDNTIDMLDISFAIDEFLKWGQY